MAWSPTESAANLPGLRDSDRGLAVTMVMKQPSPPKPDEVVDRTTQICETLSTMPDAAIAGDDEGPSIEEYMEALLIRTRQGSRAAVEKAIRLPQSQGEPVRQSAAPRLSQPCRPRMSRATHGRRPPRGLWRHRNAANPSPKCANWPISTSRTTFHSQRGLQLVTEMRSHRLVAAAAITTSIILLTCVLSVTSSAYLAAVVSTVVASVWVLKYLSLGRMVKRLMEDEEGDNCYGHVAN